MEHSFDVDTAREYGIFPAVLIKNLQFWIIKNRANEVHFHDGHWWAYNSQKAFCELFPYKTRNQIRRTIDELVEKGVLLRANYNNAPMDRTMWYAFADENRWLQNSPMHLAKFTNASGEIHQPIPDNIPDIYSSSSSSSACARESEDENYNILQNWYSTAGLDEYTERKMREYGCLLGIREILETFIKDDFEVRETIQRRERTTTLKHFQNWLPNYLRKLRDDAQRDQNKPDRRGGTAEKPAPTYLR